MDKLQEETNSSLNLLKILFLILTLLFGLIFGYLPLMVKIKKRVIRYLSFFNAFSGGIFLGAGLFILIPEGKDISENYFKDLKEKNGQNILYELPWAYFFSFLSYSFLLLLEKVCFNTSMIIPLELNDEHDHDGHIEPIKDIDEDEDEDVIKNVVSTKGKFASFLQLRNLKTAQLEDATKKPDRSLLKSSIILTKTFKYNMDEDINQDIDLFVNPEKIDSKVNEKHNHDHDHGHQHGKKVFSELTPYLLLFALCLDGFFEGLAIGSQSSTTKLVFVSVCLLINKCIVACNLGVSFKIAVPDLRIFLRFVLLFSLFTPFGIMLGFLFYGINDLVKAAFLSLASGSFIYVSCSVIVIEEFTLTKYKYTKFLLFLVGGISTASLIVITDNK